MFLLMLALRNGQPFFRKETILMVIIGSGGASPSRTSLNKSPAHLE
jgi:hypothetical protein